MALRLYGVHTTRTMRCLWMANELGLDYEHVPVAAGRGGSRSLEFRRLNPNGHVPVMEEDGLVLWESMAINLHLARPALAAARRAV